MSQLKQFIREIHRRSLWQVLTIYLGASWAVLEVTDQIVARYLLPEWVYPAALILLLLGLPIVLATAFVREEARELQPVAEIRDPTLLGDMSEETARPAPERAAKPIVRHLTWPRAILGGALAFAGLGVASALIVVRGSARVTEAHGVAGEAFEERAWIVLAEFEAPESEKEIALAAQTALSVDLQQSQYVNVRGRNQIVPVLRRMGLPDTARLDETIALEVAQREGMAAVLVPAVARLGGDYVFSARVIQPGTGRELIAVRTAARAERLLEGVEALSRELRSRLGEASEAIRQSRPLPEVTTSSLEALRKYALAKAALEVDLDNPRAAELAVEATRLDTSFAMAYRLAGVASGNSERHSQALEYSQRAYELRDRLTDRERMHVEGTYYSRRYDIRRAAEVYDVLLAQYPDDDRALNNLAVLNGGYLGHYERAYRAYLKAIALNPYSALRYNNAIHAAYTVGRLDVADSLIAVARAQGFEQHAARWSRRHAVALGDFDRADALCDSLLREAASAARFADDQSSCGSVSAARGRISEAIDRMEAAGRYYGEQQMYLDYPNVVVGVALAEQIRGRPTAARARLEAALDRFPADSIREFARVVYRTTLSVGAGLLGYTDLQERFAETYPEPSGAVPWTVEYADAMVSAARSVAEVDPEGVLAALHKIEALGYELSGWLAHAHLMHGLAFQELADPNAEVVYLEELIHPRRTTEGGSWGFITLSQLPFALRRLAELAEARGDTEAAIAHYRTFLDLWSDPDPELRDQVASAERALARLAGSETSQ
jgi:tetratricopeptide (TPR) repeat protein